MDKENKFELWRLYHLKDSNPLIEHQIIQQYKYRPKYNEIQCWAYCSCGAQANYYNENIWEEEDNGSKD